MTAVVTGIGVAAPNGLGTEQFWRNTCAGRTGIGPITRFDASSYPVRMAGEVTGFDPAEHLSGRLIPQTDRMTQLALAATDWALADAGVDVGERTDFDMGVVTANSSGGFAFGQRELQHLWADGPHHVSAYQSFAWFYAVNTGQISIRHGMRGPTGVLVADQAGGLDAIGHARRNVRKGTPLVVTGAVDSSLCPWGLVAQLPTGRLSERGAYLPFDTDASGYVIGEGGAILIVEEHTAALRRGAPRVYGEIAGYRATFGESRFTAAIRESLDDAELEPSEVDVVFADAAGVPELDRAEVAALAEVFGVRGVPVTAPKTMTGRLNSGGAPLDVATALLAMRHGIVPPTVNVRHDSTDIDLVTTARQARIKAALVVARGHGGFNSAMVVRDLPIQKGNPND